MKFGSNQKCFRHDARYLTHHVLPIQLPLEHLSYPHLLLPSQYHTPRLYGITPRSLPPIDSHHDSGTEPIPGCRGFTSSQLDLGLCSTFMVSAMISPYQPTACSVPTSTAPLLPDFVFQLPAQCPRSLGTRSLYPQVHSKICLLTNPVTSCCSVTDSLGHLLPASGPIVCCQTALLPTEGMEQMEYS